MAQLSLKAALYTHLTGLAGLTALVSTRIYPAKKPQGKVYPQVTYLLTSGEREWTMVGPAGHGMPTFDINCLAQTQDEADAVALAIRGSSQGSSSTTLDGFVGWMGGASGIGVYIQFSKIEDQEEIDDDNQPKDGSDVGIFRVRLSWALYHDEP